MHVWASSCLKNVPHVIFLPSSPVCLVCFTDAAHLFVCCATQWLLLFFILLFAHHQFKSATINWLDVCVRVCVLNSNSVCVCRSSVFPLVKEIEFVAMSSIIEALWMSMVFYGPQWMSMVSLRSVALWPVHGKLAAAAVTLSWWGDTHDDTDTVGVCVRHRPTENARTVIYRYIYNGKLRNTTIRVIVEVW